MNKTIINKSLICAMVLAATLPLVAATETVDGITWTYTVANGVVSVGAGSQWMNSS